MRSLLQNIRLCAILLRERRPIRLCWTLPGRPPVCPHVVLTIVDKDKSSEEIETCRQIAAELGVKRVSAASFDS